MTSDEGVLREMVRHLGYCPAELVARSQLSYKCFDSQSMISGPKLHIRQSLTTQRIGNEKTLPPRQVLVRSGSKVGRRTLKAMSRKFGSFS